MASDSESSRSASSSSEDDRKKRKSHKKHKRKSEKKHKKEKRSKHKKRDRHSLKDAEPIPLSSTSPAAIPALIQPPPATAEEDTFGPALPPHLLQQQREAVPAPIVGPVLPHDMQQQIEAAQEQQNNIDSKDEYEHHSEEIDDEDVAGTYGPLPVANIELSATQRELEQRALELKIAAMEGMGVGGKAVDQKEREEWMLELPEVGLKGGLAALANMKRTFHQGKERPDFSDRSSWTKTPQDGDKPPKPETSKSAADSLKRKAEATYERARDEEQERIARKHKKKHKRDESLLELHQKKLRKEKKKKEKELAASGGKPERRPFSRDVDLKLNKIDSDQTKKIVDKAKILNTKFASGHTKYL